MSDTGPCECSFGESGRHGQPYTRDGGFVIAYPVGCEHDGILRNGVHICSGCARHAPQLATWETPEVKVCTACGRPLDAAHMESD